MSRAAMTPRISPTNMEGVKKELGGDLYLGRCGAGVAREDAWVQRIKLSRTLATRALRTSSSISSGSGASTIKHCVRLCGHQFPNNSRRPLTSSAIQKSLDPNHVTFFQRNIVTGAIRDGDSSCPTSVGDRVLLSRRERRINAVNQRLNVDLLNFFIKSTIEQYVSTSTFGL